MKVTFVSKSLIKLFPLHQLAPVVQAAPAFNLVKHFFMGASE